MNLVSGQFRFVAASSLIPPRVGSQTPVNVASGGLSLWLLIL